MELHGCGLRLFHLLRSMTLMQESIPTLLVDYRGSGPLTSFIHNGRKAHNVDLTSGKSPCQYFLRRMPRLPGELGGALSKLMGKRVFACLEITSSAPSDILTVLKNAFKSLAETELVIFPKRFAL